MQNPWTGNRVPVDPIFASNNSAGSCRGELRFDKDIPASVSNASRPGKLGYGDTAFLALRNFVSVTIGELRTGAWNRAQLTINPAQAKDVRYIWLEFGLQTAALQ